MSTNKNPKPFKDWSRKQKRDATVEYRGRNIPILQYLAMMNAYLSNRYRAVYKDSGQPIDHYTIMLKNYMAEGLQGVQEYLQLYDKATEEQERDLKAWQGEGVPETIMEDTKQKIEEIKAGG